MEKNRNLKIILSYHNRRCAVLRNEILCPVQTGCALAEELFPDMWHDDDGENISSQNPKYCELSAHYWVWKNPYKLGNPDFIGLMHDRRHFLFNTALPVPNQKATWFAQSSVYMFPPICPSYAPYISQEAITPYFPRYDCMVLKKLNVTNLNGATNMRDGFLYSAEMTHEIFDVWYDTVKELFPAYEDILKTFTSGTYYYLCNMFVMRKDLFEEYSSFLFPVLEAVDKKIDSTGFSVLKKRFLGLLGEYMLSLFVMNLYQRKDIHIAEVPGVFFLAPDYKTYRKLTYYKFNKWFWRFLSKKRYQRYVNKCNRVKSEQAILKFFK